MSLTVWDSELLTISYNVMATTRLIVDLNTSFALTRNVENSLLRLTVDCNQGQRMPLQHIACSFPIRTTVCDIQARAFSYRKSKHFAVVCE